MTGTKAKISVTPLLFTTLVISVCSIVYELIIGSLSSYLMGDSVKQFSITIGLYLFAMGVGSYLSKHIDENLFSYFATLEILVGIIGGFSSIILFYVYIYTNLYMLVMYLLIVSIGLLVGLEIPLLIRIIENNGENLKNGIANLFAFDYLGGLIGSLAFPLLMLPKLGYITTSFLTGILNISAATVIVIRYKDNLKNYKLYRSIVGICLGVLIIMMFSGEKITDRLEQGLYRDTIIHTEQTPYQKIVMTRHKDDIRLFLNGNAQFSSVDEYRYHEPLVHVPMSFRPDSKKILLLGAGDGLAAKEFLKYNSIEKITIVDLDKDMVDLCRTNPLITQINNGALDNPKVDLIFNDAFIYIQELEEIYDVIIVDLPDPENETLAKLYSTTFYHMAKNTLSKDGIIVTQSSSPYYTGNAFWCINKTMGDAFQQVVPYHLYVPSFGDWGFNIASNGELDISQLKLGEHLNLQYLNENNIQGLFAFADDEIMEIENLESNTLFKPIISDYYQKDVEKW